LALTPAAAISKGVRPTPGRGEEEGIDEKEEGYEEDAEAGGGVAEG
jgi:hypothetical protein